MSNIMRCFSHFIHKQQFSSRHFDGGGVVRGRDSGDGDSLDTCDRLAHKL